VMIVVLCNAVKARKFSTSYNMLIGSAVLTSGFAALGAAAVRPHCGIALFRLEFLSYHLHELLFLLGR
jgi:hypothetical protein